jgi:hypothetical protein
LARMARGRIEPCTTGTHPRASTRSRNG